jgi:hypothetical protein
MLPFGVTMPVTVPQRSEIPEGLMNNPVYLSTLYMGPHGLYYGEFDRKIFSYKNPTILHP